VNKYNSLNWAILALCLFSFLRGAYDLGGQSLWWDESLSHYRATRPLSFILTNQMRFLNGKEEAPIPPDNHPPLYFVLLRAVVLVAGDSEFAMRFLSLAVGVLTIPLLYQCGKRLFDPPGGALAAALGALSPLYLWAQQEARPYALGTLLATASFYALLRVLGERSIWTDQGRRGIRSVAALAWPLAYLFLTAALLLTHYHSLLLLPVHGLIVLIARCRDKRRLLWIMAAIGIVAGLVLAWGWHMMPQRSQIAGYEFIPLGLLLQDVLRSFPLGVKGTGLATFQWVDLGLLLAALAILAWRWQAVGEHAVYLALGFALPVAEIYVVSFVRPAYMNIRHLIFASPFYYMLLAAGITQARHSAVRVAMWLATAVLLVGMAMGTTRYFSEFAKEDHRAWGRYLSEHVRPGDLVLINPGAISDLYFYYVHSDADYYGFPPMYLDPQETIDLLQTVIAPYERVWVAQSLTPHWANPGDLALKWLQENEQRIASAHFYSQNTTVQAQAFRLKPPLVERLPDDAIPLALDMEGQVRLLGWRSLREHALAGHTLPLSLYWLAPEPLDQSYRITLSLVDDEGFSWALVDDVPCSGTYPTTRWPAGHIVRDDVDVDLPVGVPPGSYRIQISVYPDDGSGSALVVRETGDSSPLGLIVPIGRIDVAPSQGPADVPALSVAHPAGQRYGDLTLLGHDRDGGTYQAGDIVLVDAAWRALRKPRQDWAFELRLRDAAGEILASQAISPSSGYPPTRWDKGEIVRGQYRFRIPIDAPPGEYTLQIGLADGQPGWIWPWERAWQDWATVVVRAPDRARSFDVPSMEHTVGAILGDRVELLGYDLATDTIRPGEVVSYTLYWRALEPINQNYTVFNHLVAPDGRTWGQWDNQPQRGLSPTTRWVPGEVIADPYQVPVAADAPAGPLAVQVGMYDRWTMTRLPVDGGDTITLLEVKVTSP
jgi:4-amino-4-deoxy-L-arabinose transferase-like glycosyltransferase